MFLNFILQVFFLVVIFGLFHGLVYFPIILSLLGPKGYSTPDQRAEVESREKSATVISNEKVDIENGAAMNGVNNGHAEKGMCC